ncbi:MAG: DUF1232 domain-containing protein [Tissierellia bacterium]|nr:DUF1232 domain-containing protein [Tissierellia bacterium]
MRLNYLKIFKRFWPEAKKIYVDRERFEYVIRQSMKKTNRHEIFSSIHRELTLAFFLCLDFIRGRYRQISKKHILMIIVGLLYLLNPMDLIPDFIFGIGLMDDLAVFSYILTQLKTELDNYESWRDDFID